MSAATASLAHAILRVGSKQSYFTARLMVDKNLVNDFCRAYAYFRWADDVIDVFSSSDDERISFIERQKRLVDSFYRKERPGDLVPEEKIAADLISHDKGENSGLQSFIRNMLAIIEFDANRKGRLISQQELTWYTNRLGKSVIDGIQYFIGNGHPYPTTDNRSLAAIAAHIAHLLRDMVRDTADGFINIPREYLESNGISPEDIDHPKFLAWVKDRVQLARQYFRLGKLYINQLEVLRCRIVGLWYCARFESVLDTIERDGYLLRAKYNEKRKLSTWLRIVWLFPSVSFQHIFSRGLRDA